MRLEDVTAAAPVRRMGVARGSIRCTGTPDVVAMEAAAIMAVKRAPEVVAALHPIQVTDAHLDVARHDDQTIVTCTVQGMSRVALGPLALAGVLGALLAAFHEAGGVIADAHVVQDVG